jgi:hypothetical protein
MIDDRDPLLTRLFAERKSPGAGSEFATRVDALIERELRNARFYRMGMIAAAVVLAALLAPWIAQVCALGIGSAVAGMSTTRVLSSFPLAWLAVASIVASVLPVIYLGITRRW